MFCISERRRHHKKHSISETDKEYEKDIDDHVNNEEKEALNELRRIELPHPVHIREGEGLSVHRKYTIDFKYIQSSTYKHRECSIWYRKLTKDIRENPRKNPEYCINLNDRREKCLNQLIYNTFNNTEEQVSSPKISFIPGSKLYCENKNGLNKFLGHYTRGILCFYPNDQIHIDYEFTDIAGISDINKNQDALEFIENNSKLNGEFGDDCHEETNLVETEQQ